MSTEEHTDTDFNQYLDEWTARVNNANPSEFDALHDELMKKYEQHKDSLKDKSSVPSKQTSTTPAAQSSLTLGKCIHEQ